MKIALLDVGSRVADVSFKTNRARDRGRDLGFIYTAAYLHISEDL